MGIQGPVAEIVGKTVSVPYVSVLMSVYNGERWLRESIQSVLAQTFSDFEFIIINDGSTDRSLDIMREFELRDARIRLLDKANTGLADSLNYGLERARGEWVARIDADDICHPLRLDKQVLKVKSNPKLVLLGTGLRLLDEFGNVGESYRSPIRHKRIVGQLVTCRPFFAHSSVFFKAALVQQIGGYRGRILRAEDLDLWLRIAEFGELACLPEPLVFVRKHENQVSNEDFGNRQAIDSHVAIICYFLRRMNERDPVESLSGVEFEKFHRWLVDEMHVAGIFSMIAYKSAIRRKALVTRSRFSMLIVVCRMLITSPRQANRLLRQRFFGSSLPLTLALRWVEARKCVI